MGAATRLHAARRWPTTSPTACSATRHEPVFTAGRRTASWERPTDGAHVVDVDRGGRITWHGPGQLTGYQSSRCPAPWMLSPTSAAYRGRPHRRLCRPRRRRRTGRRPQRSVGLRRRQRSGPQGRGHRRTRLARCHDARLCAQLRLRPGPVPRDRPCGITDAAVTSLSGGSVAASLSRTSYRSSSNSSRLFWRDVPTARP